MIVGRCQTPRWIAFLMICWLVYNIRSYFNELILVWSAYLNENPKIELKWWVQNLKLCNGQTLIQSPAEVLMQTDASTKGWRATCNGISTGGDVVVVMYRGLLRKFLTFLFLYEEILTYKNIKKKVHKQIYA